MEEMSVVADRPSTLGSSRLLSLAVGSNNTVYSHRRHYDDDDNESYYVYRERPRTAMEKVGECFVSVTCTSIVGLVLSLCVVIACVGLAKVVAAIMFWSRCPASPDLPIYLLVSGLSPAIFYITCRTRRKYKGAISGKQRILARWEFSVLHVTFDTGQSWQAGLAALLCIFLLVWLCLGTALTVATKNKVEAKRDVCTALPPAQHLHPGYNASESLASASLSSLSLLSSMADNNDSSGLLPPPAQPSQHPPPPPTTRTSLLSRPGEDTGPRGGIPTKTPQRVSATTAVGVAAGGLKSESGSGSSAGDGGGADGGVEHVAKSNGTLFQLALSLVKNRTSSGGHTAPPSLHQHNNKTPAVLGTPAVLDKAVDHVVKSVPPKDAVSGVATTLSSRNTSSDTDVTDDALNVTRLSPDDAQLRCTGCDEKFLTVCFSLVLFDWAYVVALLLNLVIVGTVPLCCFKPYHREERV